MILPSGCSCSGEKAVTSFEVVHPTKQNDLQLQIKSTLNPNIL